MNRRVYEKAGRRAETLATWYLRLKGYQILARRFKTKVGEIDIVARKKDVLVIVEVKQRETQSAADESFSAEGARRIANAGELFFSRSPAVQSLGIRYDLVLVIGRWKITHIPDAWRNY